MKTLFSFLLWTCICANCLAQKFEHEKHKRSEYVLYKTGDISQYALPLTAGLITIIKKDKEGTKQFLKSYATTLAATYALKNIIHKQRPEGRNQFDSFPSGHTSSAFSGASFLHRRYGLKYGIPAYLLAITVGISRIEGPSQYHDTWDVLGGALIGIGSSWLFAKPIDNNRLTINPSFSKGSKIISATYKF